MRLKKYLKRKDRENQRQDKLNRMFNGSMQESKEEKQDIKIPDTLLGKDLKLILSPLAFSQIEYTKNVTQCEVSSFGILNPEKPLYVDRVFIPKQRVSSASVDIDTQDLADTQLKLFSQGIQPWQSSVWIHTHPKGVLTPSGTDNNQMRIFSTAPFMIMLIRTKCNHWFCRLDISTRYPTGQTITLSQELPVYVDTLCEIPEETKGEFKANVTESFVTTNKPTQGNLIYDYGDYYDSPGWEEFEKEETDSLSLFDMIEIEEGEDKASTFLEACWRYNLSEEDTESYQQIFGHLPDYLKEVE